MIYQFIAAYLLVGVGHAFTLYEAAKALTEATKNSEFSVSRSEAFVAVFVWPLFLLMGDE